MRGERTPQTSPRRAPRPVSPRSGYPHSSAPGRLSGREKLSQVYPTQDTLPALHRHVCFPCRPSVLQPAGLFANSANTLHSHRVWRLPPHVPVTAGSAGLGANSTVLGLAACPPPAAPAMPADVPTRRHTARPFVSGQEPARFPPPTPRPTRGDACSRGPGETRKKLRPQITLTFHLTVRTAPCSSHSPRCCGQ